jgi:GTPase SAR1 family protein
MALQRDWHTKPEAKSFFNALNIGHSRRSFGLLDRPIFPKSPSGKQTTVHTYKIWVTSGPMATGKSSTILKLAGQFIHHEKVYPTPGVEVTVVYWPMKNVMSEDVLLFRLEFWEAGSIAVSRYGYIEEMIHEENSPADAILLTYSCVDRNSFDSLPEILEMIKMKVNSEPLLICMATHADQYLSAEVPESDARKFASSQELTLMRSKNVNVGERPNETIDAWSSIQEVGQTVGALCDLLYKRDLLKAQDGLNV